MPRRKQQKFINKPEYPGGHEALRRDIHKRLVYPPQALKNQIEGTVVVNYAVDQNGKVLKPEIEHGIGYGCDEEAIRIISSLKFGSVKNPGMKVKINKKTSIHFKRPPKQQTVVRYHVKESDQNGKGKITYQVNIR